MSASYGHESAAKVALSAFAEKFLVGTVEAVVRAGSRFVESLTDDAAKAVKREQLKLESLREGVKNWRAANVGEIDMDVPEELRGDQE